MENKKVISVDVSLKEYTLGAVRYAAYALSGSSYVFLRGPAAGRVTVEMRPKPGLSAAVSSLPARLRLELEDEKLREKIFSGNKQLREFLFLKALTYTPEQPAQDDSGLTPQQEKELNSLIAQIEGEIKTESAGGKDPLKITGTWEEKYDTGSRSKKSKR